jgi:Beta-galactosidase/beta-glucuronidase
MSDFGYKEENGLMLSGNDWFIIEETELLNAPEYSLMDSGTASFIPAKVPGNIQADLESSCRLRPIWYGIGDPGLLEVARKNWWYRKDFDVPSSFEEKCIKLVFDGVDYSCEVWLNGVKLGTHDGMFQRFGFDVSGTIKAGGKNHLAVRISRMPEELVPYLVGSDGKLSGDGTPYFFVEGNNKTRQVLKGLKSPANFSYDWGTNIWTLGIWKDVKLEVSGPARIEWVQVQSKLADGYQTAYVNTRLEIESLEDIDVKADFCIYGDDSSVSTETLVSLKRGINIIEARLPIDKPELWWPNGYGGQPMYRINTCLKSLDGFTVYDKRTTRFGIREIAWEQVEGAPENFPNPFRLILNGCPIRTMGSNLVAPDLLYGRIGDRGRHFIKMAKECHMNTLRQHGGQVVFPEGMYDAADELGIMLLVDFPIANCVPENEPTFLENFDETIRNIVKQLRNHPSIIEWSGGNELDWYFNPNADHMALRVQQKAVMDEDDRLFRATCPIQGSRHAPWDYNPDIHYKQFNIDIKDNFGFIPMMRYGEFGCQTPANLEVWHREIPPESQWPINEDDPVLIRKNIVQAVFAKDFWLAKPVIERIFGELENLEMLIKCGQFIGAEGVRYMMDALRAKGKSLGGFTSWDYNEPWPNGAGSFMIDYDGRPLMMYHFVKQALTPVSLQLRYDSLLYGMYNDTEVELLLVSDAGAGTDELNWRWVARDRRGHIFNQGSGAASVNPLEVIQLQKFSIKPDSKMLLGPVFVELYLTDSKGMTISERIYAFGAEGTRAPLGGLVKTGIKDNDFGVPYVTTAITGGPVGKAVLNVISAKTVVDKENDVLEVAVENTGTMTALFCELQPELEYRTDLFIDSNFSFIPPGECRKFTVKADKPTGSMLSLAQTGWRMDCWNAETVVIPPSGDVLLSMGRRDAMCREFMGYFEKEAFNGTGNVFGGNRINADDVPFLLTKNIQFVFDVDAAKTGEKSVLRIHASDCTEDNKSKVSIKLNGYTCEKALPKGLGIQKEEPAHLAYPVTLEFIIPAGELKEGSNVLTIEVTDNGWFTWDAMDLVIQN